MHEERAKLVDIGLRRRTRLVRMDAERGVDALLGLREREGSTRTGNRRRDDDDAIDPGDPRSGEHLGRVLAEMRVGVDHPPPASSVIRRSSSSTTDSSSFLKSGFGSASCWPGRSALGSQRPTQPP